MSTMGVVWVGLEFTLSSKKLSLAWWYWAKSSHTICVVQYIGE
jgi:hypothetical protein